TSGHTVHSDAHYVKRTDAEKEKAGRVAPAGPKVVMQLLEADANGRAHLTRPRSRREVELPDVVQEARAQVVHVREVRSVQGQRVAIRRRCVSDLSVQTPE